MAIQNKKLYPPVIEGTIPAFYGTVLTVPFAMNKAVALNEVGGFSIKIKTVQSNTYIGYATTDLMNYENIPNEIKFDISEAQSKFNIGQYYKIQMAYKDKNGNVGFYSTVGVAKYTDKPVVSIENLSDTELNIHSQSYIGKYKQEKDTTEKVYKYCFSLYDIGMNLISTSGWKLHNSNEDEFAYESIDSYYIDKDLNNNEKYYLQYEVITNNKMLVSSPLYTIIKSLSIDPPVKLKIIPQNDYNNGIITLDLEGEIDNDTGIEHAVTGSFVITRSDEKNKYQTWNEIMRFSLHGQQPSRTLWKDFTVEQGVHYQYALQQYNANGLTSDRIVSSIVYADFEDSYLYDGERQLKIKFNPKVSNFKNTIMEAKIDTIGSQYPYIFRNGNVKYKEFPISGLISYYMDENNLFEDFEYERTIDLTSKNLSQEREFKLKVMEWLNNGEVKLFRSPGEGNYIVSLMNVNLTPLDTLGRMLHNFSCNAYEIAECDFKNLSSYGFIKTENPTDKQIRWETVDIGKFAPLTNLLNYEAVALKFEGLIPGDIIYIDDNRTRDGIVYQEGHSSGFYITIGITGSYVVELQSDVLIKNVQMLNRTVHQGSLTYAYYSKLIDTFDLVSSFLSKEIPLEQFIGETDIISYINNTKDELQNILYAHFAKRQIEIGYLNEEGKLYSDETRSTPLEIEPFRIYAIYGNGESRYSEEYDIDPATQKKVYRINEPAEYWDGYKYLYYGSKYKEKYLIGKPEYYIIINGVNIDITEKLEHNVKNLPTISEFKISNGVIAECGYQTQTKNYIIEDDIKLSSDEIKNYYLEKECEIKTNGNNITITDSDIYLTLEKNKIYYLKEFYEIKEQNLYSFIYEENTEGLSENEYQNRIHLLKKEKKTAYNLFINYLDKAIQERQVMQGEPVS